MSELFIRLVRPGRLVLPAALALLALGLSIRVSVGREWLLPPVGYNAKPVAAAVDAAERALARAEQDQCTQELLRWLQYPERAVRAGVSFRIRLLASSCGMVAVRSADAMLAAAPWEPDPDIASDMAVVLAHAAALGHRSAETGSAAIDHLVSGSIDPSSIPGMIALLAQADPPLPALAPVLRELCSAGDEETAPWARACLVRMGKGTRADLSMLAGEAVGTGTGPTWLPGGLGFLSTKQSGDGTSQGNRTAWRALGWLGARARPVGPVLAETLPVVGGPDGPVPQLPYMECRTLKRIGHAGPTGVARLVAVAGAIDLPASARTEALVTLSSLTADGPVVAPKLLMLLESATPEMRRDVVGALAVLGHLDEDVVRVVRDAAASDHVRTRCAGILAAGELCAGSEELGSLVLEAARSPAELERACAAWALGQSRLGSAPFGEALADLLVDPSLAVRTAGTATVIGWRRAPACVVQRLADAIPVDGVVPEVPVDDADHMARVSDDLATVGGLAREVSDWLNPEAFMGLGLLDRLTGGAFAGLAPRERALLAYSIMALGGAATSGGPAEAALEGLLAARLGDNADIPVDGVEWLVRYALWSIRRREDLVEPARP